GFIVGGPVGDFELLLCHGTVCVVGKIRDLILQLSKSSIYSTKPVDIANKDGQLQLNVTDRKTGKTSTIQVSGLQTSSTDF
uniref:curli assembly protein CsgF n=1 Tax=Enterobacter hormaechei TaxID=158836 RepID=UPI00404B9037